MKKIILIAYSLFENYTKKKKKSNRHFFWKSPKGEWNVEEKYKKTTA